MDAQDAVDPTAGVIRRLVRDFVGAPSYPGIAADGATFRLVGLELPRRATVAVVVMVFAMLADFHRNFLPPDILYSREPGALRTVAIERVLLFGALPLATILLAFRDDPRRYGLRLGDWRAGLVLAGVGLLIMVPVVVWLGYQPDFGSYYAPSATDVPNLVLTNGLDLTATEFLLRGFLMFSLIRFMGPIGVVIAAVPFTFSHLGKPELETLSTLFGGTVFGWLDWRTGSIVYSATAHVALMTLVTLAAAGRI